MEEITFEIGDTVVLDNISYSIQGKEDGFFRMLGDNETFLLYPVMLRALVSSGGAQIVKNKKSGPLSDLEALSTARANVIIEDCCTSRIDKILSAYEDDGGETTFDVNSRTFDSGAKRSIDTGKPLPSELDPYLRLRVGFHLKKGADRFGKGNWRNLIPEDSTLESIHRHLAEYELDKQHNRKNKEDHLSAIIFGIMTLMKHEEKNGMPIDQYFD